MVTKPIYFHSNISLNKTVNYQLTAPIDKNKCLKLKNQSYSYLIKVSYNYSFVTLLFTTVAYCSSLCCKG